MTYLDELPPGIARLIRTAFVAEFATVSAAGVPMIADVSWTLHPTAGTRAALMARLDRELARCGLALPTMPAEPPAPTPGAWLRAQVAADYPGLSAAQA